MALDKPLTQILVAGPSPTEELDGLYIWTVTVVRLTPKGAARQLAVKGGIVSRRDKGVRKIEKAIEAHRAKYPRAEVVRLDQDA